jgi:hypothetical protein
MATQEALVVPVELEALVVNDAVRREQPFQRGRMDYGQLAIYAAPEPAAFETSTDFGKEASNNGVYLRWDLPAALRRAETSAGGEAEFPLVPNRWLVLRYSGPARQRQVTGWVVESDFLDPEAGTSPYYAADGGESQPTLIGRKLEIGSGGWSEPAAGAPLFLRAVAAGSATFAAFQPYNQDVFSIHDPLTGVADSASLSYLVVGWYSEIAADPLASGDFGALLAKLGWTAAGADSARSSVYSGFVHGVEWNPEGSAPASAMPTSADVSVALGATTVDAVCALVAAQTAASSRQLEIERLEAFQHGVIDVLDEADGPEELVRRAHDAAFQLLPGGFVWEIDDVPGAGSPPDAAEVAAQEQWLAALNSAQAEYDAAARELQDLRRRLYETWWLVGRGSQIHKGPTGVDLDALREELDPSNRAGLAAKAAAQAVNVEQLGHGLPSGETEAALGTAIEALERNHRLPASRRLKRAARQPFARAGDPVLLLGGTGSKALLAAEGQLACRFPDQLVTGLSFEAGIAAAQVAKEVPLPNLANLPAVTAALAAELFLLDPVNAATMAEVALGKGDAGTAEALEKALAEPAKVAIGTLPPFNLAAWAQPWSPLHLLWELEYYPIDFSAGGPAPWAFDGTGYAWPGSGAYKESPLAFSGRTLLTPQAEFNLRAQIARYEESHPDQGLEAVADFIAGHDHWDFLSQALDGLGAMLALRDPRTRPIPPEPLAALVAGAESGAPVPGPAHAPFGEWEPSLFQQLRAGQIAFGQIAMVDRFGRAMFLVDSPHQLNLEPALPPGLRPQHPVLAQSPQRFVQLPPRLPQPARVRLRAVSASDDAKPSEENVDANPICGWLLCNHLDGALAAFAPDGSPLGELRVVIDAGGQPRPAWVAAPGAPYREVPEMKTALPHLASALEHFTATPDAARAADLEALLAATDEALAEIDPPGSSADAGLALLAGRPLCLVRAEVRLELDGPALNDPSWRYATELAPTPEFASYRLPVRLGEEGRLGDGLVGYFTGSEYGRFSAVRKEPGATSYVAAIAQGNLLALAADDAQPTWLTLLVDPRAPVHAISDVLPVATLQLPPALLREPLATLSPAFRCGPLLTTSRTVKAGSAIVLPRPALHRGNWSWAEIAAGEWKLAPVEGADQAARLPQTPIVRDGVLKLSGAEGGGDPGTAAG